MASRLVVNGVSDDKFEPGRDVFSDVTKGAWYYDAISIAHEYNLIDGYGKGKFGPMDRITREQAMAIATRAMNITRLEAEYRIEQDL